VAGLHVDDALAQCALSPTKAARIAAGVIASARTNAAANHGLGTSLSVAEAVVGRAQTPTRPWFHGKGRTGVRSLYRSHLHIRLAPAARGPVTRFVKPLLERRPPKRGREGGAAA
jgi:large subunit ribosomal protein L22